jgi:hypothetical protein
MQSYESFESMCASRTITYYDIETITFKNRNLRFPKILEEFIRYEMFPEFLALITYWFSAQL